MFLSVFEDIFIGCLLGNSMGFLLGSMVRGGSIVIMQYVPLLFVPFTLMAGFLINTDTLGFFTFMKYTSPLKYMLEVLMRAEFEDFPLATKITEEFGYNSGDTLCRIVVALFFVGARVIGYLAYIFNVRKYV